MRAVFAQVEHGRGFVPELLEYRLMSEFGWTQNDIDRADFPRVIRAISANNYAEVIRKSNRDGVAKLSESESELLGHILQADTEANSGD